MEHARGPSRRGGGGGGGGYGYGGGAPSFKPVWLDKYDSPVLILYYTDIFVAVGNLEQYVFCYDV